MYKKITTIEEIFDSSPILAPKPPENEEDKICVDVPLFIRLLEYAREDAKTDMDLHTVAKAAIELSESGKVLTMDDYSKLVAKK
jgi:hypothetical protein